MTTYVRNPDGALINTDDSYYKSVLAARESEKKSRELERDLNDVRSELIEIKKLLKNVTGIKCQDQ